MPKAATQTAAVNRSNAEHYRWGTDCDAWRLVKNDDLTVIEEFIPSGGSEVMHYHKKAQQFFYIISGEVMMEMNGKSTLVQAGSGIHIAPGVRHRIRNPSSAAVRLLVISTPPSHGDKFED
jgi:mannose-6-phosphate isomerase-like protein (cupin superfamily)